MPQIDHILVDRRGNSNILDVWSIRGADCETDHSLVVAKVMERLAVSKFAVKKIDTEKFDLKKLSERKVK
jgi:hypothetical protein